MSRSMLVSEKKDIFNPLVVTFEEREKQIRAEKTKEEETRKREKQSPYSRWAQFNLDKTERMMWLGYYHPKARIILDFLVKQMDEYNAVMCSYQVLQETLGLSRATIARGIKVLKNGSYIAVLKSGTSSVYAINDSIYWKSWGNNKKYSKFPANVVLAMSEQEKSYQLSFADLETDKIKSVSVKEDVDGEQPT